MPRSSVAPRSARYRKECPLPQPNSSTLWGLASRRFSSFSVGARGPYSGNAGDEVIAKIEEAVPPARQFIRGVYRARIEQLASKLNPSGREVRWHKKDDLFCLPYETRQIVETENVEDEALRVRVLETLAARATSIVKELTPEDAATIADIALRALQLTFETEGLEFAAFLHGTDQAGEDYSIGDGIDNALVQSNVSGEKQIAWKEVVVRMLRTTIYESTEEERLYLGKLSRTYLLLFSLNAEPRIIEYFQTMASDFYLYVGSDILIHALSERYLRKEDQMTTSGDHGCDWLAGAQRARIHLDG